MVTLRHKLLLLPLCHRNLLLFGAGVVGESPDDNGGEQNGGAYFADILRTLVPHMLNGGPECGHTIGWQLHNKGRLIFLELCTPQQSGCEECHANAQQIESDEDRCGIVREECACQQEEYGESCATRHKGGNEDCYEPRRVALDGACGHNCGHIAAEAHKQRYERLAVQPHTVHQLIHNESRTSHIARILHKRDEEIEDEDVGQEYGNAAHTTHNAIYDHIPQSPLGHNAPQPLAQPTKGTLNPLLWIAAEREGCPEHQPHKQNEERKTEPLVGHKAVYAPRTAVDVAFTLS